MTEQELEAHISQHNSDVGRFVLAKLLIEGCSDKVPKNNKKGENWLKESAKNGNINALEYKTQMDIRFAKQPNI
jgi:TPR repeat protein